MRTKAFLLALLLPCAAWADGMVGEPVQPTARIAPGQGGTFGDVRLQVRPDGSRVIVGGSGGASDIDRRLADNAANLARERADAEARRRTEEQERLAALNYAQGSNDRAARDARDAADLAAWRRQRDLEMDAALTFSMGCHHWDKDVGCRGPQSVVRP